jgi:hypothetical protein
MYCTYSTSKNEECSAQRGAWPRLSGRRTAEARRRWLDAVELCYWQQRQPEDSGQDYSLQEARVLPIQHA